MIVTLNASGDGPSPHRHCLQDEFYQCLEGKLGVESDGKKIVLVPGRTFTVPKDAVHRCYSVGGTESKFNAVFTPALNIQCSCACAENNFSSNGCYWKKFWCSESEEKILKMKLALTHFARPEADAMCEHFTHSGGLLVLSSSNLCPKIPTS
ncbi:MAG: cupin domain-containing protein [Flavobacteriales bacterium]|nr:cupin domain-containing protein [Flavobacteriales bacterium]